MIQTNLQIEPTTEEKVYLLPVKYMLEKYPRWTLDQLLEDVSDDVKTVIKDHINNKV